MSKTADIAGFSTVLGEAGMIKIAFIIGSARSGTTILGEILNHHPDIVEWYEPYYLWRKYFLCQRNEVWLDTEFNEQSRQAIKKEHFIFKKKSKNRLIVEKMPSHSFNIRFIHQIFPTAKWIHIIRDGRDVTLSMKKEWLNRKKIIENKNYYIALRTAYNAWKRPPFLRYKLMLLLFELTSNFSLHPSKYLNKAKWKGTIGWGPRFAGWEEVIQKSTPLEFHAMQWVKTVEAANNGFRLLPNENKIEIRYEELLKTPEETLVMLLDFLEVRPDPRFFDSTRTLKRNNFNKWESELTDDEIKEIKPILDPWLEKLGYLVQQ